ncbi:MAG: hypothetical protein K8I27_11150 [Planctomycetes bacterium]|nr:hypothetical protein [Planctomycetota bacterium]
MPRFILLSVLLLTAAVLSGQDINDMKYGFTARVPAGFNRMPPGRAKISASTIHAFYVGDLDDAEPDMVIGIEHLGGTIGRERLDTAGIPKPSGAHITAETAVWKDFEVDVLVTYMTANGHEVFTMTAQIPLKREAIQVTIAAPRAREAEVRNHMRFMLENLDGESNWLNGKERVARLTEGLLKLGLFLAMVVGGIILIVRSRKKRKAQNYPAQPGLGCPPQHPGPYPHPGSAPPPHPMQPVPPRTQPPQRPSNPRS